MEPEISHRCKSCGAAVRAGAEFCHQCGVPSGMPATQASVTPAPPKMATDKKVKRGLPAVSTASDPELSVTSLAQKPVDGDQVSVAQSSEGDEIVTPSTEGQDGSQSKRHRVKEAAREMVADNVMPRVEKFRHASSAMLEEAAAIDPSLRFVLIALLLFVVFIILLSLSFIK